MGPLAHYRNILMCLIPIPDSLTLTYPPSPLLICLHIYLAITLLELLTLPLLPFISTSQLFISFLISIQWDMSNNVLFFLNMHGWGYAHKHDLWEILHVNDAFWSYKYYLCFLNFVLQLSELSWWCLYAQGLMTSSETWETYDRL